VDLSHVVSQNILILFAHPSTHHSIANKRIIERVSTLDQITVNDLYQRYPDFYIDVERERALLRSASLIIFQFPFYWYSSPPMLKLWQDVVLTKGFAYGPNGSELRGKDFMLSVTTGAKKESYQSDGKYQFSMPELLRPFEATANLCEMHYRQPLYLHSSTHLADDVLNQYSEKLKSICQQYLITGADVFDNFKEITDGDF